MRGLAQYVMFDEGQEEALLEDFLELPSRNTKMFALLACAVGVSWNFFGKPLVITSIYRQGDKGVHGSWRGVDCRVFHEDRPVAPGAWGLDKEEAEELAERLNRTFQYIKSNGDESEVAILHGDGMNYHLHLQAPRFDQWRA